MVSAATTRIRDAQSAVLVMRAEDGRAQYEPGSQTVGLRKYTCRKPAPGMLIQAIREHHLDPSASWLVGDKDSDMQAAEAVGIPNRVILGASRSLHSTHTLSCLTELLELPV